MKGLNIKPGFKKCNHICFINPDVGKLIDKNVAVAGGAETQILLLSKCLSVCNSKVSIITSFNNEKKKFKRDGINWFGTTFRYLGGPNYYLFLDWLHLALLILRLSPDAIIIKHPRHLIGFLGFVCAIFRIKLYFFAAIDKDVNPAKINSEPLFSILLYRLGLHLVTGVLTQTQTQKILMKKLTPRSVYHLPSIFSSIPFDKSTISSNDPIILWVGSNSARKRPEIFFEAAAKLPALKFVMIISPGDGTDTVDPTFSTENLTVVESCPRSKIGQYYHQSMFTVSTSRLEGFPNIFLESWWFGKPVISLELDPDSVINKFQLGMVSNTKEDLFQHIQHLSKDHKSRKDFGKNAQLYVKNVHRPEAIIPKLLNIIDNA